MQEYLPYLIPGLVLLFVGYWFLLFFFDLLLRGFLPFLPSRPWVVDQLLRELEFRNDKPCVIALSTGRSGFLKAAEKKWPQGTLIGVQTNLFPYLVSKFQSWIQNTRVEVYYQPIHRVDVRKADVIYSHLYPDKMEGLGRKLKFECKPNAVVISTGFNIPHLTAEKIIDLPDRKGKFDWLSKNQELFKSKRKKFNKEKKAFLYRI